MQRILLLLAVALAVGSAAWAQQHPQLQTTGTYNVKPPNGADDTANIQAGLDACIARGKGCTVQLAAGRYLTRQLVAQNFRGSFKGKGKNKTIIEALPNLPVNSWNSDNTIWYFPNTTDHPWPDLIMFIDGDITVSDMSIRMTAVPATQPYYLFGGMEFRVLLGGIRIMGRNRTKASFERISIEGARDEADGFGFNVINALYWAADLPKSSTFHDAYPMVGNLNVSSSSFKSALSGVALMSGGAIAKDSLINIGGSPSTGNVFTDVGYGIDLESLENSVVEASYNTAEGQYAALDVYPFESFPTKPSLFLIHHNTFKPTGPYADGIWLLDGPVNKWIHAVIHNNTIEAQDIGFGGISAYSTNGTAIVNNRISGNGGDAIGIWDGSYASVLGNDVTSFIASPELAQIVLDGTTTRSVVVCENPEDTVLNQGTLNHVIGCQAVVAAARASTMSTGPTPSVAHSNRMKPKLSPR
jgi:hypothetical protein